jgi:Icc-related predicted phosphoesterase
MIVAATSDLHGDLPKVPECDLLVIAGDVCPVYNHERRFQADWLRTTFKEWLEEAPAKYIVGVAGNHDFALGQKIGKGLPWMYLQNSLAVIDDLKIWGSPYSNQFGNWAYMAPEGVLRDMWAKIPRDIDILITHGPAYGMGDHIPFAGMSAQKRALAQGPTGTHVGSTSLANMLTYDEWPNLKVHFTGHIHEAYGAGTLKNHRWYNVSHLDEYYQPMNDPVVITIPRTDEDRRGIVD